jgi:streptomycin 6-kinase
MEKKRGFYLPETFKRNICDLHAEKGERWLSDLPELTGEIAEEWRLFVGEPFPNLSYHYVAPCVCDNGSEAVLKIGFAEKDSIVLSEAKFLNLLNGNGAVKLFRFDEIRCALLLERLMPGKNLVELAKTDDEQATAHAIRVMKKIRCQPPEKIQFPTLENWVASFCRAEKTTFDFTRVKKAQRIFERLIGSSEQQLLHGDLHHQNILSAGHEAFMAIDPKGIVGDIGFEISVFLNNPRGWLLTNPDRRTITQRRIKQFAAAFTVEPQDLRDWAYAEAVLSAWWTYEDGGSDWEKWLACADIWED